MRFDDLWEFVKINHRLFVTMLICLLGLVILQNYTSSDKKECMGVVDLKETTVSFDTSVIINKIFVLPGQKVKKGQALVHVKPVETTLRLMELKAQLNPLVSELNIRNSIFGKNKKIKNPLQEQIDGLQEQIQELESSLSRSVRYADDDGIVGSVNFRSSEQVAPFLPIITLNSSEPDLVYGFIHEDRVSDFQLGETVQVYSLNHRGKTVRGDIISLGSRITQFPERLNANPQYPVWGREIVVSLSEKHQLLPGEKVKIVSLSQKVTPLNAIKRALAGPLGLKEIKVLAFDLPFEPGGVKILTHGNISELLLVSDDLNPKNGSPFWKIKVNDGKKASYIPLATNTAIPIEEDIESLTGDGDTIYALSSLKKKTRSGHIFQLQVTDKKILIKKQLEFRNLFIEALSAEPVLKKYSHRIRNKIDVEGFSVANGQAIISLKKPVFDDGSSIVVKISNFSEFFSSEGKSPINLELLAPLQFSSSKCKNETTISDITLRANYIYLLSNCSKENISELWKIKSENHKGAPILVKSFDIGNLEGMDFSADNKYAYLSRDSGKELKSSVIKTELSLEH